MPSHLRGLEPGRAQMGVTKALWVVAFVSTAMQALQVKRTLKSAPLRSIRSPPDSQVRLAPGFQQALRIKPWYLTYPL